MSYSYSSSVFVFGEGLGMSSSFSSSVFVFIEGFGMSSSSSSSVFVFIEGLGMSFIEGLGMSSSSYQNCKFHDPGGSSSDAGAWPYSENATYLLFFLSA